MAGMKWIGTDGVLTFKGKDIGYGDSMPDDLPESSLKHFIKTGRVGQILEPVTLEPEPVAEPKAKDKDKGKG